MDQQIKTLVARRNGEEDKIVNSVQTKLQQAEALEQSYKKTQDAQDQEALGMRKKGIRYAILDREVKANRALYDELASKSKESGVAGQYKGTSIQIMDKAETPQNPVLPQTQHELMVAFIEGCILALGLVFGFEYLDSRIKTPDELKSQLGLSFLGIVPVVPGKEQTHDPLLLHNDVPPGFSEALRAIRTSIIFSSADEGSRAIVITSTAPGEGKTLVSTNLAVALAHAGQRTIIIDGDMRRPRTHDVFDRPQEPGLSNVLVGTARIRDAVRMTNVPNLYLLPAGHIPPNPAELLGSTRYLELLDELRQEYDWVLIDAPPVMAVTDAAILANTATGVVFVVGAEMTSRRNALAAIEQLTTARAKFIGAVLNRVDIQRHSYYYAPYYRKDYAKAYERARK
jgi:capsular exopolysaccharide synthesis family protein